MEFHEPSGLEKDWFVARPTIYACSLCNQEFDSLDRLRKHRFEDHPIQRPALFIAGRELGIQCVRVTAPLAPELISTSNASTASYNGEEIELSDLPTRLAKQGSAIVTITLCSENGNRSEFELDFRIAKTHDLEGVEHQFFQLASSATLNLNSIENFIAACEPFETARSYYDGICQYLYGILAKEGAPSSNLKYESYTRRYNQAVNELTAYDRPLAISICALVEFHFNHFKDSVASSPDSRVGHVARKYRDWVNNIEPARAPISNQNLRHTIDSLLTDPDTEKILQWSVLSLTDLVSKTSEMRHFIGADISDFDKKKVEILMAETLYNAGELHEARQIARSLRNLPLLEKWAESMLARAGSSN